MIRIWKTVRNTNLSHLKILWSNRLQQLRKLSNRDSLGKLYKTTFGEQTGPHLGGYSDLNLKRYIFHLEYSPFSLHRNLTCVISLEKVCLFSLGLRPHSAVLTAYSMLRALDILGCFWRTICGSEIKLCLAVCKANI